MSRLTRTEASSYVLRERRRLPQVVELGAHSGPSSRGSSYYKTLLACPREFALSYEVGLTPAAESEPLIVGTLVHLCLDRYYSQLRVEQASAKVYWSRAGMEAAYAVVEQLERESGYEDTVNVVRRILDGYFDEYADEKLRILAAEETIEFQGAFAYTARLDTCVINDADGGFYVMENKTARAITADLLGNYEMDLQILGQAWLVLRSLDLQKYPPFKGVLINIATKHEKPRFQRFAVCPSPFHIDMFERVVFDLQAKRTWAASREWPMSLGHCSGYARGYSRCQFYDLCHNFPQVPVAEWLASKVAGDDAPLGYRYKEETDALVQERA